MKKVLLIAIAIFISAELKSQNLFSNPDFEVYTTCPVNQAEVSKAVDWVEIIQSADYMNCTYTGWTGQTLVGAQNGTGYMGFASYNGANATEAIGQQLSTPLVAGTTYNLSLYAKKTSGPNYASNCSGVCFYGFPTNPYLSPAVAICPEDSGGVLLACTDTVYSTTWQPYNLSFVSPGTFGFIGIAVGCQFTIGCGQYIYIDNLHCVVSSITENELEANSINVFQNANSNYLHVSFKLMKSADIRFSLVNILGETIFISEKKFQSGLVNEQFAINSVSNGIYFLKIESEKSHFVKKVFVSH